MTILFSFLGMAVLIGLAVAVSKNRRAINLRTVGLAFALQFGIGGDQEPRYGNVLWRAER